MKTRPFFLSASSLTTAIAALTLGAANAQPESAPPAPETEKTEDLPPAGDIATGRVFSVEPTSLLVTPANVSIPLTFTYNVKTPLMDEADKPVLWDQIKDGLPVTVHYETHGDKLIATKVIVTRKMLAGGENTEPDEAARKREMLAEIKRQKAIEAAERAKALPASGGGTIMGFEQVIAVRTPDSADVVQYVVNNSTLYVDSTGQPVPLQFVRTGVPVSIQYVEDAGRRIATQFVLERIPRGAREVAPVVVTRPGTSPGTRSSTGQSTITGTGQATTVDENGNVVSGVLEDGFVNPPVTVLPSAGQPGATPTNPSATAPKTGSTPKLPQPNQPGVAPITPQPNTPHPGGTQPGTQPPGTGQPGSTTPPRPGAQPGTPSPGNSSPGGSPGSPPAPTR